MRTKLADRKLPTYTRGEETFNMISHIVGGGIGVVALISCIVVSALHDNVNGILSSAIYGITMIMLYTMSSIYHGLVNVKAKKVFQVLDHCTIYLLIAGTCTPIALSAFQATNPTLGWIIFGVEWGLAALAITLTAIDLKQFGAFSMICYIVMGWIVIVVYKQTIEALTEQGFTLLLIGGILYTIGAVLYGIGSKKKYMHNAFHVFVLLGSVFHYLAIVLYAI